MSRRLPAAIARLAAFLLPPPLRDWGRAMQAEVKEIEAYPAALGFALGCLGCAIRQAAADQFMPKEDAMHISNSPGRRPRRTAMLCAAGAVGLGFAYMAAAGAPGLYFVMNGAALLLGIALVAAIGAGALGPRAQAIVSLAMGLALLFTALRGVAADGVTRWVSLGGIALQPSLLLVPLLAMRFARTPDGPTTIAIVLAAAALALQPDRAMAGALLAGALASALVRPGRNRWIAVTAALAGFLATVLRPDFAPAMPYVDRIFFSSFAVHPLAGVAVLAGALLLLVPALAGARADPANRHIYIPFGAVWLAVLAAAALGNYPTPLVGYGGSAIIGYLLSLTAFPARAATARAPEHGGAAQPDSEPAGMQRAGLSVPA